MWNYSFIIPNFMILITVLLFYFSQPRLPIFMNKAFLNILVIEILILIIDVAASVATEPNSRFPVFFISILNLLFFLMFQLRAFLFFFFNLNLMKINSQKKAFIGSFSIVIFVLFELFVLTSLWTKSIYSIDLNGHYSRGPFYNIIYVCIFLYLTLSFILTVVYRKTITKKVFINIITYNFVLLTGYTARFLFPSYLLMGLFTLVAILVIYLSFENPDLYIDRKSRSFNLQGLSALINEQIGKKNISISAFIIHNYNELREIYTDPQMDASIRLITVFLKSTFPTLTVFYIHNGRFVLVGTNSENTQDIHDKIEQRFQKPWITREYAEDGFYLETGFVIVDKDITYTDSQKILNAIYSELHKVDILKNTSIVIKNETLSSIDKTTEIKRALEYAIENDRVELFLQPVTESVSGKIIGAEALARIRDNKNELIPPGLFIPLAEQNGRINILGEQMFEKTCCFIKEHNLENTGISWINVNLSPIQFLRPDLYSRFSAILQKYGVSAKNIHLEITEESMIDYSLLKNQINTMKNLGFQFVLDDYGRGYSNVTRLKHCPFINIKLDMEVVKDYFIAPDKILPTLVETFKQMNFSVTAEGIETKDMADSLKSIGCDFLQGYHFAKPMPSNEFAEKFMTQQ